MDNPVDIPNALQTPKTLKEKKGHKQTDGLSDTCHSCWMASRIKEVVPNRAMISRLIDLVKAVADSDVTSKEHE